MSTKEQLEQELQIISNALEFLDRANLNGKEYDAFGAVKAYMNSIGTEKHLALQALLAPSEPPVMPENTTEGEGELVE